MELTTKPLLLYDRSRVTCDWKCPRERFWRYEYEGKGIVANSTHLELYLGTAIHDGLAAIARGLSIDEIADAAREQILAALLEQTTGEVDQVNFAHEQASLVEGLLRGFYRQVWPWLMQQYPRIVCIEQEMVYKHDGLTFMSKPDLVVEDPAGNVYYIEYKSTSSKKDDWINSWNTAIQLHSTVRAVEATIGRKVVGVQVVGLYKGFVSYGKQSSPMCYAYKRTGTPPFSEDQIQYEYKAGFKRFPVWEQEGGVKKWVEEMPEEILAAQFPLPPPIFVNDGLVDTFFAQRAIREHEIALALQMMKAMGPEAEEGIMNATFQQKFDQCVPGWGKPCAYRMLCHGSCEDPLEAGFITRESHHQLELEQDSEV